MRPMLRLEDKQNFCLILVGYLLRVTLSQNANDKQEIKPALIAIKAATETLPNKLSADNGYMSGDNLQALKDSSIDSYIATNKGEMKNKVSLDSTERKLVKADFDYDEPQTS